MSKKKVVIIGAGQQGGSIARALNGKSDKYDVSVTDVSSDILDRLAQQSDTENVEVVQPSDLSEHVKDVDIVILATPMDQFASVLEEIGEDLPEGCAVSDIGSGKVKSIESISAVLPKGVRYVPIHPINGKALPGPENSDPDMYKDQTIVVVPTGGKENAEALNIVCDMWDDMGGDVNGMLAGDHDRLYGAISHFEHVVAFALTNMGEDVNAPECAIEDYKKGGESLLATTRIAVGSTAMWIPIFLGNKQAILETAESFKEQLDVLESALDDRQNLESILRGAHGYRVGFSDEKREVVQGEVCDFYDSLKSEFNEVAQASFARRIGLPTFIGAAITTNAMDIDKQLTNISLPDLANPSFKDGSAPMLSDPAYVADLLHGNVGVIKEQLNQFRGELGFLVESIRSEDKQAIRTYIEKANAIRSDMPPKASPDIVRKEFDYTLD